jgi:hypothetical protein
MKKLFAVCVFALLLLAVPALAAERTIYNGIDPWVTRGDGSTFADFSKAPIPAGFFCNGSDPFTGRIVFRGAPLATGTPGALGNTDTIVQRLDDATFNKRGVATTRIQVRSLNFENVAPVKTSCGVFKVRVTLDGEQPITIMSIIKDRPNGGRYLAPIGVNLKMVFEPMFRVRAGETLELTRSFLFPPDPRAEWSVKAGLGAVQHPGVVLADTDGDRNPDTYLPGTSNFAAGWGAHEKATTCHTHDGGTHCVQLAEVALE